MISTNRSASTRDESKITDVTTQFQQMLQVFSPRGPLLSPQTWGEPPVGPNVLTGRDGQLGHTSRVLAAEAASAIGCHDLAVSTERDLQRLVGNTIDKTMAGAIISRTIHV